MHRSLRDNRFERGANVRFEQVAAARCPVGTTKNEVRVQLRLAVLREGKIADTRNQLDLFVDCRMTAKTLRPPLCSLLFHPRKVNGGRTGMQATARAVGR
jgi:hypothetical protein